MKVWDPEEDKEPETLANAQRMTWLDWCMVGVGILLAFWLAGKILPSKAEAHSWYSYDCCSGFDCRPISGEREGIPWSEVRDMGDHYEWRSPKTNVTHKIPKSSDRVRPSQDGNYHGCELAYDRKFMCLYVPMMF